MHAYSQNRCTLNLGSVIKDSCIQINIPTEAGGQGGHVPPLPSIRQSRGHWISVNSSRNPIVQDQVLNNKNVDSNKSKVSMERLSRLNEHMVGKVTGDRWLDAMGGVSIMQSIASHSSPCTSR